MGYGWSLYHLFFIFSVFFSQLTIDESYDKSDQNYQHNDIYGMAIFHYQFSVLFQIFPDKRQKGISESCADDGIDDELC